MKKTLLFLAAAMFAAATWAGADTKASDPGAAQTSNVAAMTEGEVRKIDTDSKKITLRHGEIKNLDMPPMTMVFAVADPAFLGQVKVGDKVKFVAEKQNGALTLTHIERAQ